MKALTVAMLLVAFMPHRINDESHTQKTDQPMVLMIGDSISLGYTPHVTRLLEGKAVVSHAPGNAEHTGTGLQLLEDWIGETKWSVIYFNWGLWDLCYRHPDSKHQGKRDKINGSITTTLRQYEQNLDLLVSRLKETNAVLIWANTTVVPEDEAGRFVGDDKRYNDVAAKVMKKHDIAISDLNELTSDFTPDLFESPGNVHYTNEGYRLIGERVAKQITVSLASLPSSQ